LGRLSVAAPAFKIVLPGWGGHGGPPLQLISSIKRGSTVVGLAQ
jgi:hypothetical protein